MYFLRIKYTEETFKKRYQTYLDSTSPIINYYKQKGILESINSFLSLDSTNFIYLNGYRTS